MMGITFQHYQSAHCESGVTRSLLTNNGKPLSEAMAFGIGSGLFFVHLPFVKVMGLPLTSYRSMPGSIFKKTCQRLDVPTISKTFSSEMEGQNQLDMLIERKGAVGVRANIYWLGYIPESFRFQFNAHNLIVCGKNKNQNYIVSDPVLDTMDECSADDIQRARFSKGPLSPKGLIYYPDIQVPGDFQKSQLQRAIRLGIKETSNAMLFAPLPFVGCRGIRYLGTRIEKWFSSSMPEKTRNLNLANIVRMQEEIGTGGAGFRYLYAEFLRESAEIFGNDTLMKEHQQYAETGRLWREFATSVARFCKGKSTETAKELSQHLENIAQREKTSLQILRKEISKLEIHH